MLRTQREKIEARIDVCESERTEVNNELGYLVARLNERERDTRKTKELLDEVSEKLGKTMISIQDLEERRDELRRELEEVQEVMMESQGRVDELRREGEDADKKEADERRMLSALIDERDEQLTRRNEAEVTRAEKERRLRDILGDHNSPIEMVIENANRRMWI
jgi:chromosome segregation ATPase